MAGERSERDPNADFFRARARLFEGTGFDGSSVSPPLGWTRWERPRLSPEHPAFDLDGVIETLIGRSRRNSAGPRKNAVRIDEKLVAGEHDFCPFYDIRFHVARAALVAASDEEAAERARADSAEMMKLAGFIEGAERAASVSRLAFERIEEVSSWEHQGLAWCLTPPVSASADARPDYAAWNARQGDMLRRLDALAALAPALEALRAAIPALYGLAEAVRDHRAGLVGPGSDGNVWERAFARTLLAVLHDWTGAYPDTNKGILHKLLDAAVKAIGRGRPKNWARAADNARKDLKARPEWDRPGTRAEYPPGTEVVEMTEEEIIARRRRAHASEIEGIARDLVRYRTDVEERDDPLDPVEIEREIERVRSAFDRYGKGRGGSDSH